MVSIESTCVATDTDTVAAAAAMTTTDDKPTATIKTERVEKTRKKKNQCPYSPKLWETDTVTQIDCNVDDCTGEQLSFVVEILLSKNNNKPLQQQQQPHTKKSHSTAIVLDAWITPIVGKKGRPAHILSCLCREDHDFTNENNDGDDGGEHDDPIGGVLELIFRHTTTIGIRVRRGIERVKLQREVVHVPQEQVINSVEDDGGKGEILLYNKNDDDEPIGVKIAKFTNGEVMNMKAEYDDCRLVSLKTGIPIQTIAEHAVRLARDVAREGCDRLMM